jgi:hypothetical protein
VTAALEGLRLPKAIFYASCGALPSDGCGYGLYLGDGLIVFLSGSGSGSGFGLGFEVGDFFFGKPFFVFADVFDLGFGGLIVFFVFFFFEIFAAPGVFTERGIAYGAGIDDDAGFDDGLEVDAAEVGGGGLEGVEQEAGGFGVDLPVEDEAHDLHERDLDGICVLEHGQVERGASAAGAVGVEHDAGFLPILMEVAIVVAS